MEKVIEKYILGNKVFTIATSMSGIPYCAQCFYAYDAASNMLIFLSDNETKHITHALVNSSIAGTISTKVTTIAKIQGIQLTGEFIKPTEVQQKEFYAIYYQKFPFAKAKLSSIWGIQLNWIKMTDNTLGFGKKLVWERDK